MNPLEKKFKLAKEDFRELIPNIGSCVATDHITVQGKKVGYMYREEPDSDIDSGWRFFSGEESQEYVDDADNMAMYSVNTICNYDQAIVPYLDSPPGSQFGRVEGTDKFKLEN